MRKAICSLKRRLPRGLVAILFSYALCCPTAYSAEKKGLGVIMGKLRSKNQWTRVDAVVSLGRLHDPDAVAPLITALGDKSEFVREEAADTLYDLNGVAVEPLMAALHNRDANIRRNAATVLGRIGDIVAVHPLVEVLGDKSSGVRENAVWALNQLGDNRAVEPVMSLLRDRSPEVRRSAATVLGKFGDRRAVEALLSSLNDKDAGVRNDAAYALGSLGDERGIGPLIGLFKDNNMDVRETAAHALCRIGRPSVPGLVAALNEKNVRIRMLAIGALSGIDDEQARTAVGSLRDESLLINVNYYSRSTTIIIPVFSAVAKTEGARRATGVSATRRSATLAVA